MFAVLCVFYVNHCHCLNLLLFLPRQRRRFRWFYSFFSLAISEARWGGRFNRRKMFSREKSLIYAIFTRNVCSLSGWRARRLVSSTLLCSAWFIRLTTLPQLSAARCTSKAIKRDSIKLSKLKSGEFIFCSRFGFSFFAHEIKLFRNHFSLRSKAKTIFAK